MSNNTQETQNINVVLGVVIALLLAFPLGYVAGNAQSNNADTTTVMDEAHSETESDEHTHDHVLFDVDAADAPMVMNVRVTPDAMAGWNISFDTENFTFAPENASSSHVAGQGHAHLYIDGEKITRLYANNYYISELGDVGEHEIEVTLNTNDHQTYSVNGEEIAALTTVTVTEESSHSHDETDHGSDMEMN
ncbi:TPA: hypothetical protein EYO12_03345 [Candidatus Saccharibacteria bacterium]|nr:hypothetical protein [Candidatus Saccharibacteria bacterium]HIO87932.1 hypothetical protein [Candidatus Saccharibacteria bacterium]